MTTPIPNKLDYYQDCYELVEKAIKMQEKLVEKEQQNATFSKTVLKRMKGSLVAFTRLMNLEEDKLNDTK